MKTDNEILKLVLDKIEHEDKFTSKIVYSIYAQYSLKESHCLLNAQHVNIGLPQIFRNTKCTTVNCLGRRTLKKNIDPSSDPNDIYNATSIKKFDNRTNLSFSNKNVLLHYIPLQVDKELTMRQFYDMFDSSFEKDGTLKDVFLGPPMTTNIKQSE